MANTVNVTRYFNTPARELFPYFMEIPLLEQWSAPDGMTLKIPVFEAREGGRYRYEHTSPKGLYVCEGHLERIIPNESLSMIDEWMTGPDGKRFAENLQCDIRLTPMANGCEVSVEQRGFQNQQFADECQQGWTQCLNKLENLTQSNERVLRNPSLPGDNVARGNL